MYKIVNSPVFVFTLALFVLSLFARIGAFFRTKLGPLQEDERHDFGIVMGAALTLLGLLIGFSFSMAVSRYDQRKNYEAIEANAIGTEYNRADMLPPTNAATLHELLKKYLDQRIAFYEARDQRALDRINADTARLEAELWSQVRSAAVAQPTPVVALATAGMNEVLDAQGFTEAAWWNRIPTAAWTLMAAIAIYCELLIGYAARSRGWLIFVVLPLALSISFLLIADIDTPRGGLIQVLPQNLLSLSQSLQR